MADVNSLRKAYGLGLPLGFWIGVVGFFDFGGARGWLGWRHWHQQRWVSAWQSFGPWFGQYTTWWQKVQEKL